MISLNNRLAYRIYLEDLGDDKEPCFLNQFMVSDGEVLIYAKDNHKGSFKRRIVAVLEMRYVDFGIYDLIQMFNLWI